MNKKSIFFSVLLLSLVVTGCNNKKNSSSENPDVPIPETFDHQLVAGEDTLPVFVGEEKNILIVPELKTKFNLKFTSLNPDVATVDENGKVTGVAQGVTKIAVQDLNRKSAGVFVNVEVVEKLKSAASNKLYEALKPLADAEVFDNFIDHRIMESYKYKNGVVQEYGVSDAYYTYSESEAYFGINEYEYSTRIQGGAFSYVKDQWIFYTNQYYDTYTYHSDSSVKNYYVAATSSYLGQKRSVPMKAVLDNLFISGSKIFTQAFDTNGLSYVYKLAKVYSNITNKKTGSLADGHIVFSGAATFDDSKTTIDDESRYGIPYGTTKHGRQEMTYRIVDNKYAYNYTMQEETYEYGGDSYAEVMLIHDSFEFFNEGYIESHLPNKEDYTLVDYLFAI